MAQRTVRVPRHLLLRRLMRYRELSERASDFSADYCLMVLKCCYLWLYYVNLHRANADGKIINNSPMFYCSFMHLQPLGTRHAVAAVKMERREFQLILFFTSSGGHIKMDGFIKVHQPLPRQRKLFAAFE